jgi:hypothetical protein
MTRQLRHRLSLGARLAALLSTSYFLIATSEPGYPPGEGSQTCTHAAQTVSFDVTGTCGPSGIILVRSPADECLITVEGAAAVGLPAGGRFDAFNGRRSVDLLKDPWTLSDVPPDPAIPALPVSPDAGANHPQPRARQCKVEPWYPLTDRVTCTGATVCSGTLVRR